MKQNKKRLTLQKLEISKLTNYKNISGGGPEGHDGGGNLQGTGSKAAVNNDSSCGITENCFSGRFF